MKPTPYTIRRYLDGDRYAIYTIERLSYKAPPTEEGMASISDRAIFRVADTLEFGPVGFAIWDVTSRTSSIIRLAVHPEFRRFGIGSSLMGVITQSADAQLYSVRCDIDSDNLDGAMFLKKLGFTKLGFTWRTMGEDVYRFYRSRQRSKVIDS